MDKIYYTIYKTTNQINGKFYIGSHKTRDLDDNYYGSGKYLKYAINKHGLDNFTKEILFIFDTPEEMYAMEAEIVNEDFLAEENTYNLKVGGFGGFDYINNNIDLGEHRKSNMKKCNQVFKEKWNNDDNFAQEWSNLQSSKMKNKHRAGLIRYDTFTGKTHTEETKSKMREAHKKNKHMQGEKNSQYGTMWITNDKENKKIKKTDSIPEGFRKGRKINKVC